MSEPPVVAVGGRGLSLPLGAAVVELAAAFVLGPRACTGGLELYFSLGGVAVLVCVVAPWLRHPRISPLSRAIIGGLVSGGAWLGGLFLGNFQIFCRLF